MSKKEMIVLSSKAKPTFKGLSFGNLCITSLRVLVLSVLAGACFFGIDRLFMFLMARVFGV